MWTSATSDAHTRPQAAWKGAHHIQPCLDRKSKPRALGSRSRPRTTASQTLVRATTERFHSSYIHAPALFPVEPKTILGSRLGIAVPSSESGQVPESSGISSPKTS